MTLPNFLVVGAAKAGTTTIYDMLVQHPEVGMSIMKEPNFFSDGWPKWAKTLDEYKQLFSHCSGKKAIGEASPFYFSDPESAERIKSTLGEDTKIIIFLRNPAKRTYSHWAYARYIYNREPLSFHQALEKEDERAFADSTHKLKHYYSGIFRYVWISMYSDKVQHFLEIFGKNNVKVVVLEEFVKNPKKLFQDICQFLEIDPLFIPILTKSNPAGESAAPGLTNLISAINQSNIFNTLYRNLPFKLKIVIFNFGNAVFEALRRPRHSTLAVDEQLDEITYKSLMKRFMTDIRKLEKLLGRDLSVWY